MLAEERDVAADDWAEIHDEGVVASVEAGEELVQRARGIRHFRLRRANLIDSGVSFRLTPLNEKSQQIGERSRFGHVTQVSTGFNGFNRFNRLNGFNGSTGSTGSTG